MTLPLLARAAERHVARMLAAIRPASARLTRQFRELLRERPYDSQQIAAFLAIAPPAAARLKSTAAFFEQVQVHGRRLAKLNVPPAEARETLREFDALAGAEVGRKHEPAREQLQLATILVLNQAYYDVRESEAQAFFGVYRAELEADWLDDLLRRVVRILTQTFRARSGRLLLFDAPPDSRLVRPLYTETGGRLILDTAMRGRHAAYWSYPLRGAGVVQFGFGERNRWLPRDLSLLDAAAERCCRAIELRRMEARERQAEENERRRLGRELHDEAGQSLLLLRMELEMMEHAAEGHLRERLRDARLITEKTVEELRRIVAALSPAMLERLGLDAALRQLAARFERAYRSDVDVRLAAGAGTLPMEIQQVIYRVAQECLQNAAKHSQASRVNLCLRQADKRIMLSVSDNGAGFSVGTEANKAESFGLAGMRERAALFGGTLAVKSAPGKGARVTLVLPRDAVRTTNNGKDSRIFNR